MSTGHGITCDCGETFATVAGFQDHLNRQTPEVLYTIVDPSTPEGQSMAEGCDNVFGVLYAVEEFQVEDRCEHCEKEGAYHLQGSRGAAVCRQHLEQAPWVAAVVESKDEIEQFKMPEGPVRTGEQ
ncbi:hypothetical protein [Natrinema salinisoli]|uniref:hypothetical protein n=1 Tax=Natrinema salinisoli TaxID=2878535 RepID=UPI001CEFD8DE|nr:hypothetical protein [Natrinema salinisoli]